MSKVRTFRKAKWLCFAGAISCWFLPTVITVSCLFPLIENADTGYKTAVGTLLIVVNALPCLLNSFKSFTIHFPFMNWFAIGYCMLALLFSLDFFADHQWKILVIEGTAALGGIVACIFWALFKKYSTYAASIKATIKSGAFIRS